MNVYNTDDLNAPARMAPATVAPAQLAVTKVEAKSDEKA